MIRNLKALGLALVAVFAMSALVAGAAQAEGEPEYFHSGAETENTIIEGSATTNQVFETESGAKVSCSNGDFVGTEESGTVSTVTTSLDYYAENEEGERVKCDGLGGSENAEVRANGCTYTFDATTDEAEMADVAVSCPVNAAIEIEVAGVVLDIGTQNVVSGVGYTNTAGHITLDATATGIEWTCTASAFVCTIGVGGTSGTATYTGTATVRGYDDNEEVAGEEVEVSHG